MRAYERMKERKMSGEGSVPPVYTPLSFEGIVGRHWSDDFYKTRPGVAQYKIDYETVKKANAKGVVDYARVIAVYKKRMHENAAEIKKDRGDNKGECGWFSFSCYADKARGFAADATLNLAFGAGIVFAAYMIWKKKG